MILTYKRMEVVIFLLLCAYLTDAGVTRNYIILYTPKMNLSYLNIISITLVQKYLGKISKFR